MDNLRLRSADYFSALPDEHIFIVRASYTDGSVRGRLSYLKIPAAGTAWPFARVPASSRRILDPMKYRVSCTRPDDLHAVFMPHEIVQVYRFVPLTTGSLSADASVSALVQAILSKGSDLSPTQFAVIGSRLFGHPAPGSDVDLVFLSLACISSLHSAVMNLEREGRIRRLTILEDTRLTERLQVHAHSRAEIEHMHRCQWFRKYLFEDRLLFNLSFASINPVLLPQLYPTRKHVVLSGVITEDELSYSLPCRYTVREDETDSQVEVYTYLWPYRHSVMLGDRVRCHGRLARLPDRQVAYINEVDDFIAPIVED